MLYFNGLQNKSSMFTCLTARACHECDVWRKKGLNHPTAKLPVGFHLVVSRSNLFFPSRSNFKRLCCYCGASIFLPCNLHTIKGIWQMNVWSLTDFFLWTSLTEILNLLRLVQTCSQCNLSCLKHYINRPIYLTSPCRVTTVARLQHCRLTADFSRVSCKVATLQAHCCKVTTIRSLQQ